MLAEGSTLPTGAWYSIFGTIAAGLLVMLGKRLEAGDIKNKSHVDQLTTQLVAIQTEAGKLHEQVGKLMGDVGRYAADVARLEERVNTLTAQNAELLSRDMQRQMMLTNYETKNIALMEQVQTLSADNKHLATENARLATQNESYRRAFAQARARREARLAAPANETKKIHISNKVPDNETTID